MHDDAGERERDLRRFFILACRDETLSAAIRGCMPSLSDRRQLGDV
jgi:hypothetical protein